MKLGRAHEVSAVEALPLLLALLLSLLLPLGTACQPAERFNGQVVEPRPEPPRLVGTNWNGEPFELGELQRQTAATEPGRVAHGCDERRPADLASAQAQVELAAIDEQEEEPEDEAEITDLRATADDAPATGTPGLAP